jgi:ribosomal-protein-alanine N-acetyltransferase
LSDFWNQGFATEMARASLEVGFGRLGFQEICSWTLPTNLVSQRVMEKLGFQYERDFEFAGLTHRFYRLAKGERRVYDEVPAHRIAHAVAGHSTPVGSGTVTRTKPMQ